MTPPRSSLHFGETMLRLSTATSPPTHTFGGAESNTAVALARLGRRTRWLSVLPDLPITQALLRELRQHGVTPVTDLGPGDLGTYHISATSTSPVYRRDRSAFAHLDPTTLPWAEFLATATCLHLTGITPLLGHGPAQAWAQGMAAAQAAGVPVVLDLNHRPALGTLEALWEHVAPSVAGCSLLVLSMGDLEAVGRLVGAEGDGTVAVRLAALGSTLGVRGLAVTQKAVTADGHQRRWSLLWTRRTGVLESEGLEHAPVEALGGGDAWLAGLLDGWQRLGGPRLARLGDQPPGTLRRVLRRADVSAALALATLGDHSQVSRAELEAALRG